MNILQVIPYFCRGGAETMCRNLALALSAQGHRVSVASLYTIPTPLSQELEAAGIRVHYLNKRPGFDPAMIPRLAALMGREKPEVVHTHLNVITYAVAAAHFSGVPRCVHTVHNVAQEEAENRLQKAAEGFYFRHGWSTPVALSPLVRQTVTALYGLPEEAVPVVANGVDLSRFRPKAGYALHDTPVLLHIGRFTPQKNHQGLLEAFSLLLGKIPGAKLQLVGGGELEADIRALAAQLGLAEHVEFVGEVTDVSPYLYDADIFVLPSHYEGLPMTLIESMAAGLPIAAAPVGGVPDLIQDGETGLLAPADPSATAAAWQTLLESASLRRRLGQAARSASRRFSADQMARQYAGIYCPGGSRFPRAL